MPSGLLVTLLLIGAVVFFIIAAIGKPASVASRGVALGLACFAGAFLLPRLL